MESAASPSPRFSGESIGVRGLSRRPTCFPPVFSGKTACRQLSAAVVPSFPRRDRLPQYPASLTLGGVMYFDRRLWQAMQGTRGRVAAGVAIGLLAAAVGIARFVFLGQLLALVLERAPAGALAVPALATAGAVLLRGGLEHLRTMIAH